MRFSSVTGDYAAHAPTFADWKSHVLDDFRNEQVPALLGQKTTELAQQAKATNDLAKAAKEMGAKLGDQRPGGPDRAGSGTGSGGTVAPQLFDMVPGTMSGPINAGRTGVVAKIGVTSSEPSAAEIAGESRPDTRSASRARSSGEAFQVFATNVINRIQEEQAGASSTPRRRSAAGWRYRRVRLLS